MYDREEFYHALLDGLHAPKSDANLHALRAWGECEGSDAEWNPLDTTQHAEGATEYNSFNAGGTTLHVWNYPDKETGVAATVETLRNGHYDSILAALEDGHGRILDGNGREEMGTWGTNADCIAGKLHGTSTDGGHTQHETSPVALEPDTRSWAGRLAAHLRAREHRLTHADAEALAALAAAIKHARGVK